MTKQLALPGEVIDLDQCETRTGTNQKTVLIQSHLVQMIRLLVPAGSTIPTHEAAGQVILHCLEGQVSIVAQGVSRHMSAGQLLYLAPNEAFLIRATEHASVLATIIAPKQGANVDLIGDE